MNEIWLPIPGNLQYEVSNLGRVRSLPRTVASQRRSPFKTAGRILRPATLKNGYRQVMLGRDVNAYVHELVLLAFRCPRPVGYTASHLNGIRDDNRQENLVWESQKENNRRQADHGTLCRGERNGHSRLTAEDVYFIRTYPQRRGLFAELARKYGVACSTIEDAYKSRTWRHLAWPK